MGDRNFIQSSGNRLSSYAVHLLFISSAGAIIVTPHGKAEGLAIREIPGAKALDLLYSVRSVHHSGQRYTLRGAASWASFTLTLQIPAATPGLLHLTLALIPHKDAPTVSRFAGDVRIQGAPASALEEYAPAPPVAGTSVMLSSKALGATMLYFANLTSLGAFFDRTETGVGEGVFEYPNAGTRGAPVGSTGTGSFGYPVSASDLSNLPHNKPTTVLDSYLYLVPGVPRDEGGVADTYLRLLGTVYDAMPKPAIPSADWGALASKEAGDLLDPSNWVTVGGRAGP